MKKKRLYGRHPCKGCSHAAWPENPDEGVTCGFPECRTKKSMGVNKQ